MTATIKSAVSLLRKPRPNSIQIRCTSSMKSLTSVPASNIPEEFRKLSRYLQVTVLVPKSVVHDKTTQKKPGSNESVTGLIDTSDVCSPLDAAKAWLKKFQRHRHV